MKAHDYVPCASACVLVPPHAGPCRLPGGAVNFPTGPAALDRLLRLRSPAFNDWTLCSQPGGRMFVMTNPWTTDPDGHHFRFRHKDGRKAEGFIGCDEIAPRRGDKRAVTDLAIGRMTSVVASQCARDAIAAGFVR